MKKCTDRKGVTILMALLLLLPMISMIAGGVGAVTQSEIDALKEEQRRARSSSRS